MCFCVCVCVCLKACPSSSKERGVFSAVSKRESIIRRLSPFLLLFYKTLPVPSGFPSSSESE